MSNTKIETPSGLNYLKPKSFKRRRKRRQQMKKVTLTKEQLKDPNISLKNLILSKHNVQKSQQNILPKAYLNQHLSPYQKKVSNKYNDSKVPKFLIKAKIVMVNNKPLPVRTFLFQEDEILKLKNLKSDEAESSYTSASFSNRKSSLRWSKEETKKFYKLLEIFGCDFSMMATLFKGRTRKQIKNKFLKEEKSKNLWIEHALKRHSKIKPKKMNKRINKINKILLNDAEWISQNSANNSSNSSFLNSSNDMTLYKSKQPIKKQKRQLEQVPENQFTLLNVSVKSQNSQKSQNTNTSQDSIDKKIDIDLEKLFTQEIYPYYQKQKNQLKNQTNPFDTKKPTLKLISMIPKNGLNDNIIS